MVAGILVAIILVASLSFILTSDFDFPFLSTSGFSTLSLTNANLESNAPSGSPFSGQAWVLTVRLGGLGQSAYGTFSPSDVEDETNDGSKTTKDFSVSVTQQDQECIYPIQNTNQNIPIKKWNYQTWTYVPYINPCSIEEAQNRGINNIRYVIKPSGSLTCYAVYSTEQSPVGIYGKTDIRVQMNVDIEAGSKSGSIDLDTDGSSQGAISNFAFVEWQGNLDTGKSCPYTTDIPYVPVYRNGQWINGDKQAYNLYVGKYNEGASTTFFGGGSEVTNYVNALNSRAESALVSKSFGSFENRGSQSNGRLVSSLSSPIQNPVLTFYIKADTLGIYTPSPNIKFLSSESECFKTGTDGFISVKARNDGETGTVDFYAVCDGTFSPQGSREYGFSEGEERTIVIPISASASSKITGTCTVYAEHPLMDKKQISTSVCVDPQITCDANKLFCGVSGGNSVVKQCSSDGATSSIKETCQTGYVCDEQGNTAKCVEEGTQGGGGFFSKIGQFFKDLFSGVFDFLYILKMFIVLVGGIISIFVSAGYLNLIKELEKRPYIKWPLAVVIGFGIGYLLYAFIGGFIFWILVVAVILWFLIPIFFPMINLAKKFKRRK